MSKVWRATLHAEELISCGFDKCPDEKRWPIIEGLLRAKGLPECYLQDRTPFKCTQSGDDLILEFDS